MKRFWWLNPVHDRLPAMASGMMIVSYIVAGVVLFMPPLIWVLQNPVRWWFEYWVTR